MKSMTTTTIGVDFHVKADEQPPVVSGADVGEEELPKSYSRLAS